MNEEKALTRIDSEYEKALAERDKLQAELDRLTKKEMQDKHVISVITILASAVNLKLYSKETFSVSSEQRFRLIAVLFYTVIVKVIIAAAAVGKVIMPVNIVIVNQSATAFTSAVMVIVALLTDIDAVI